MHAQIKRVIERLAYTLPGIVLVELTCGMQTPLGKLLHILHYRTNLTEVMDRGMIFGYPNNGGEHGFTFRGPYLEAIAAIELIKETMLDNYKLSDEERQVANELSYVSQEIHAHRARNRV